MSSNNGIEFDSQKVRRLVAEKGWTHEDMAWECGMARSQLTSLLKIGRCRHNTLSIIADALGVEVKELILERKDEPMKIMLDPDAKLPSRAYRYDAGLDLYAKDDGQS